VATGNDTNSSESQAATAPENKAVVGENDATNSASQFSNATVKGTDADGTATADDAAQGTSAQLPQTDETTQATSLLGLILLSVTGMLGLAGKRRRD
jgi:LPXTG-motif cell wall-anchored protein